MRLASRVDINGFATGALQVSIGGSFGAVCTQAFDNTDAGVACRELGFVGGLVLPSPAAPATRTSGEFLSPDFREKLLEVCQY